MPRKQRVDIAGYHHVLNRGVNRENIFLCDEDKQEFLRILGYARLVYDLTIHAFCVMDNHYHLLIQTHQDNLSLAVRHVNSKYAIYFNRKMNRVGPLWQGRFKSWYVFEDRYLCALVRYIENYPLKAGLAAQVGEYPFTTVSLLSKDPNAELLAGSLMSDGRCPGVFDPLDETDLALLTELRDTTFRKHNDVFERRREKTLADYFQEMDISLRNASIFRAFLDGYGQGQIARHLGLSAVAISKIVANEWAKSEQFERLKVNGFFWSYSQDISYTVTKEPLLIETVLKYADMEEIKILFSLFGQRRVKEVWREEVQNDRRFIKLNYFLARIFFNMDVEAEDFKKVKNARADKLRLLAG